ncbi:MAG TPA: hypothetical protein VEC16_04425 [Alphaproteobacteria bacterium]|nr:hypothetical protein [Alphaproteobacteria bacterium]
MVNLTIDELLKREDVSVIAKEFVRSVNDGIDSISYDTRPNVMPEPQDGYLTLNIKKNYNIDSKIINFNKTISRLERNLSVQKVGDNLVLDSYQ